MGISDGNEVFREAVYPFSYNNANRDKAKFRADKIIKLQDSVGQTGLFSFEVVVHPRKAHTKTQELHSYGCRIARNMNADERKKGTYKDERRRLYCGSSNCLARQIRHLAQGAAEVSVSDIVHSTEHGEIAHAALLIELNTTNPTQIEASKTKIVHLLWSVSGDLDMFAARIGWGEATGLRTRNASVRQV